MSARNVLTIGRRLVRGQHLGAAFPWSILRLAGRAGGRSDAGVHLFSVFFKAEKRARLFPNEHTLKVFDRAAQRLEEFGTRSLTAEELKVFREEIAQSSRVVAHRAQSVGAPMPESARFKAIMSEASRVTLNFQSARYQAIAIDDLLRALGPTATASERLAFTTYRRMLGVIGHEMEDGWSRVFDYCARNARQIAEAGRLLRQLEIQHVRLHGKLPAIKELLRKSSEARGSFFPIRGELAEIYLHHWPDWRIQLSGLEEIAAASARKLGRDWSVKPFSSGALIDGKKAWDEGILLIKAPTAGDRFPRAVLHTAAQVKVEKHVTALDQIILDQIREKGERAALRQLTIIEGRHRRNFLLENALEVEPVRYVFYATRGRISPSSVERLRRAGLRATPQPLDISIDEFDALTLQIMKAAEDFLTK